jgi:hypothetical protein
MTEPTPSAFYFAWVTPGETAFVEAEHARFDEVVLDYRLRHEEGDFALLEVTIRNPQIPPLALEREQWAWFALGFDDLGVVPRGLFRLRAVPDNLHEDEVVFSLRARPADFEDRKEATAAGYRDPPEFDRVWLQRERWDDPDAVLDARPAAWHIDPLTGAVTISDFNAGEDGVIELTGADVWIDDIDMEPAQPPIGSLEVIGGVDWRQAAQGSVELTQTLIDAFHATGTNAPHRISSYTGEAIERLWPEEGRRIGAGWEFGETSLKLAEGDGIAEAFWALITSFPSLIFTGQAQALYNRPEVQFPNWRFWPVLKLRYEAERSFTETARFTLTADVQPLDMEAGEQPREPLVFHSAHVGEPVDPPDEDNPDGVTPLGDMRRRSYFGTDRGKASLEWLIHRGVAEIRMRARALEVTAGASIRTGLGFSLRKSAHIVHDRLKVVGGEATGKIIATEEFGNADTGKFGARCTIGCTLGRGGTVEAAAGTPDYVEEGVLDPSLQTYSGQVIMPVAGEVTYEAFPVTPNDDGVDFFNMTPDRVLLPDSDGALITVNGGKNQQEAILDAAFYTDKKNVEAALNTVFTQFCFRLVALNRGPFETEIPVTVSPVQVIRTADLEAEISS